jgi:hypothetical protein
MRIEAVIVCKNYSDFLAETLPLNLPHLDKVIIVTSHNDKATKDLCAKYGVCCVPTDCLDNSFNKGMAINIGVSHTSDPDWILHIDADVVLPHNFRNMLMRSHLNENCIYGCDRVNVYNYDNWLTLKAKLIPHYIHSYFVEPLEKIGARIIHSDYGYVPIGYFQMWHKSCNKKYPTAQGTAEHTDVLFAIRWPRAYRILLPEIFVYHLESEKCPMGTNWNGRKTKPFGSHHHKHNHGYRPNGSNS